MKRLTAYLPQRARALGFLFALALAGTLPSTAAAQSRTAPPDPADLERKIEIGPVPGLTTTWHPAPKATAAPLGGTLRFRIRALPGRTIQWSGATLIEQTDWSIAEVHLSIPGPHRVTVRHRDGLKQPVEEVVDLDAQPLPAEGLAISSLSMAADPIDLGQPPVNPATMDYFFRPGSIARLTEVGAGHFRTSTDRWLTLQAGVAPLGFAPLVEWRVDGVPQRYLGSPVELAVFMPRSFEVTAGLDAAPQARLDAYRVTIGSHPRRAEIPDDETITFTAATEPPGYEDDVTWLASTKHGTAHPWTGRGREFSTVFVGTAGEDGRWLGVKADHARAEHDSKTEVPDESAEILPDVYPPPLPRIEAPQPDPDALSELEQRLGGRVALRYPQYEGDSFFATFPIRRADFQSAEEVLTDYVEPILRALGVESGTRLRLPPTDGIAMPAASLTGLASAVADELDRHPELLRPRTNEMLSALLGDSPPTVAVDEALETGEGMSFAQFKAEIERVEYLYPFVQEAVERAGTPTPIEHTYVVAVRRDGEAVSSLRGVVLTRGSVQRTGPPLDPRAALAVAINVLQNEGLEFPQTTQPEAVRILLPYGGDDTGDVALRETYRYRLLPTWQGLDFPLLLWLDPTDGSILKLVSLVDEVDARGVAYDRDPSLPPRVESFEVDAATDGQFTLRLDGVIERVRYRGVGFEDLAVSISDDSGTSTPSFADFAQPPLDDATEALCASGENKAFQQVNFFATLSRYRRQALDLGVFEPYPITPWKPVVEGRACKGADASMPNRNGWGCTNDDYCCEGDNCGTCTGFYCCALANMFYGACSGYFSDDCPDAGFLNMAHDNTVIGHELGHTLTRRFGCERPKSWCDSTDCPIPVCWKRLHDLADFWADHFESTNCTGGWVAKNRSGTDSHLDCAKHKEANGLPRRHQVDLPFDPAKPGDHFPEHRLLWTNDYADGQIGAAALWQVRLGMRSKCRPSGAPQFAVRFARALRETGMFSATPPHTDRGIYRYLTELGREMLEQWATSGDPGGPPAFRHNGRHTTNKLTSGYARAGLFFVPPACIDGDPASSDAGFCPDGDTGGDAVIDVDDLDAADDPEIRGVVHRETDFLELGGPAPLFHVWTGPRYRFEADGEAATLTDASLCNAEFQVEASLDPSFPEAATVTSPWIGVDRDPVSEDTPECYGTWQPSDADWETLQADGLLSRLYYRARTRDESGGNVRLSTEPGNGLRSVTPPYAVLTADGRSDY